MQERALANPKIKPLWNSEIAKVDGDQKLSTLHIRNTVTGEYSGLDASGLFIAIGHDPRSELVVGQIDLDVDGYVLVKHPTTETSIPGVFACGDVVDRRYRQAITAAGTGCAAALDAEHFLTANGLAVHEEYASSETSFDGALA